MKTPCMRAFADNMPTCDKAQVNKILFVIMSERGSFTLMVICDAGFVGVLLDLFNFMVFLLNCPPLHAYIKS